MKRRAGGVVPSGQVSIKTWSRWEQQPGSAQRQQHPPPWKRKAQEWKCYCVCLIWANTGAQSSPERVCTLRCILNGFCSVFMSLNQSTNPNKLLYYKHPSFYLQNKLLWIGRSGLSSSEISASLWSRGCHTCRDVGLSEICEREIRFLPLTVTLIAGSRSSESKVNPKHTKGGNGAETDPRCNQTFPLGPSMCCWSKQFVSTETNPLIPTCLSVLLALKGLYCIF